MERKKRREKRWRENNVDRDTEMILKDIKEVNDPKEIAIKALQYMAWGYGYRGKHPITEAVEKIFDNM